MSLISTLRVGNNALLAAQVGLQVTGNNIANANTPGYIREQAVFQTAPPHQLGHLTLGSGVQVAGIVQKIDRFLAERLRAASSDLHNSATQENALRQLEAIIGELSDTDLSTSLTDFFSSINDVLNQPEDVAVRNSVVLQGSALADDFRRMDSRVRQLRADVNQRIPAIADDINRLLRSIAEVNQKVVTQELGGLSPSDAVGLRDQRQLLLGELASIIDIKTAEQDDGSVSVFLNGEFLVFAGTYREVVASFRSDRGLSVAELRVAETDLLLEPSSGSLAGLLAARDSIIGGFMDQLDNVAGTLIFEFNKIHAAGQGLTGFDRLTGEYVVDNAFAPLNQAGLPFAPVSGSFQVKVTDASTGLTKTTDVTVDLDGQGGETSLTSLVAALNGIDGISAEIQSGRVVIASDTAGSTFSFADDTSGVLAALGLNVFFRGSKTADIAVSDVVRSDPALFAASRNGVGQDSQNAILLAGLLDAPLATRGGQSLANLYDRMISDVAQTSATTQAVVEGFRTFHATLESEHLSISGVNIDEEAVNMLAFQRAFQASARLIKTIDDLLEVLVNL